MTTQVRLLLTSAGRRTELLNCFRDSATRLGLKLTIFACDMEPELSAACQLADHAFAVPRADDTEYVAVLLERCRQHEITMLVPTIDPELLPLSEAGDRFTAIGTDAIVCSPELVRVARDKKRTAELLAGAGLPSPRTALLDDARREDWPFPIVVKPRGGSASRGIRLVANSAELAAIVPEEPLVAQERLTGSEYTVNLFFDRSGRLRCAIPHVRLQVRAGEVEKGSTRRSSTLENLAERLGGILSGARGAMCFQAMVDGEGRASLFEINARFGGGYPLAHRAGATFTRWLLEEHAGLPSSAHNGWSEGVTMLRYDAAVFVEH